VKRSLSFEDLEVWRDALELAHDLYRESSRGSFGRDFALRDQIRRAAIFDHVGESNGERARRPARGDRCA